MGNIVRIVNVLQVKLVEVRRINETSQDNV